MILVALFVPALLVVTLDLTLAPAIAMLGGHPSFTVALIAVWAVLRRRNEALILAPLCGLLLGLLGNEPLGGSVLALTPVVLIAGLYSPTATEGRFVMTIAAAAAGTALYVVILMAVQAAMAGVRPSLLPAVKQTIAGAALTVPIAGLLYFPMMRMAWRQRVPGQFRRH